ncbi:hypothetical protein [Demequina salsinemoris]|uniref:hypothetical protein n=1 Tax=Demequina salsinemoris TaxID=577470 RepID=UPI000784605E|nr:hypothetical protein [Demequina salsinemoris]
MSDAPRPEDVTAADDDLVTAPGDANDAAEPTQDSVHSESTSAEHVETAAPTEEELTDAVPAVVRHAPRFSRILLTGAGTPAAIGFLLGSLLPNAVTGGRVIAGLLVGLGFGVIGGVITGVYVVTADDRASKRADAEKAELLAQQAPHVPTEGETFVHVTAEAQAAETSDTTAAPEADTTDESETR